MPFLKFLWEIISSFFEERVERGSEALEDGDWLGVLTNLAIIVAVGVPSITVPILLVYRFRRLILAIATPIIFLAVLSASFYENYKKPAPTPSAPAVAPMGIDETRANATRVYRSMAQAAFLLLTDLCRYLPGLVKPFSLASVEAPVHFDITASMVTLYHFTVGKGDNDAPVSAIEEILGSIITQHLQAQDLPISVPAVYTSVDGSTWPGLVVDGVYDLSQNYRIDLAVTNEAMISRLRSRAVSGFGGHTADQRTVQDEDFD